MEHIIINEQGINSEDVVNCTSCARAILVDRCNVLVEKHPNGAFLLPGVYEDSSLKSISGYLKNNLGVDYNDETLREMLFLEHFQNISSGSQLLNIMRIIKTKYYLGQYRGIDFKRVNDLNYSLLKLMDIDEAIELSSVDSANSLVNYYNKETNVALKILKKVR